MHVSGHAAAGELLYCYNILRPRGAMPVHGEMRHLVANAKIATDTGVPEENVVIAENGTVVDLEDGAASVVGQLDLGFVYVDGSSVGELTDADLKDRRTMAEEGFISIFVALDLERILIEAGYLVAGIAADQEGGQVQELRGSGFPTIASATATFSAP